MNHILLLLFNTIISSHELQKAPSSAPSMLSFCLLTTFSIWIVDFFGGGLKSIFVFIRPCEVLGPILGGRRGRGEWERCFIFWTLALFGCPSCRSFYPPAETALRSAAGSTGSCSWDKVGSWEHDVRRVGCALCCVYI